MERRRARVARQSFTVRVTVLAAPLVKDRTILAVYVPRRRRLGSLTVVALPAFPEPLPTVFRDFSSVTAADFRPVAVTVHRSFVTRLRFSVGEHLIFASPPSKDRDAGGRGTGGPPTEGATAAGVDGAGCGAGAAAVVNVRSAPVNWSLPRPATRR